jgi:hypothetical protein
VVGASATESLHSKIDAVSAIMQGETDIDTTSITNTDCNTEKQRLQLGMLACRCDAWGFKTYGQVNTIVACLSLGPPETLDVFARDMRLKVVNSLASFEMGLQG